MLTGSVQSNGNAAQIVVGAPVTVLAVCRHFNRKYPGTVFPLPIANKEASQVPAHNEIKNWPGMMAFATMVTAFEWRPWLVHYPAFFVAQRTAVVALMKFLDPVTAFIAVIWILMAHLTLFALIGVRPNRNRPPTDPELRNFDADSTSASADPLQLAAVPSPSSREARRSRDHPSRVQTTGESWLFSWKAAGDGSQHVPALRALQLLALIAITTTLRGGPPNPSEAAIVTGIIFIVALGCFVHFAVFWTKRRCCAHGNEHVPSASCSFSSWNGLCRSRTNGRHRGRPRPSFT
jgi:hypothetical protein